MDFSIIKKNEPFSLLITKRLFLKYYKYQRLQLETAESTSECNITKYF